MCVCVCVCVRACARARVCMCVCVCSSQLTIPPPCLSLRPVSALYGDIQDDLIRPFQQAMVNADRVPREIQQVVLELAELADFINQGRLPLSPHDLAKLAMQVCARNRLAFVPACSCS